MLRSYSAFVPDASLRDIGSMPGAEELTPDAQHLRALEEIRAQVGDLFQRDAEYCSRSPHKILLLDWPLHNQPPRPAQRSRKIAIRFGSQWLDEFVTSAPGRRIELLAEVREAIRARMRSYQDGRDAAFAADDGADSFQISLRRDAGE